MAEIEQKKNKSCYRPQLNSSQPHAENQQVPRKTRLDPHPQTQKGFWQPDLFASSEPKVTIESASYWAGRFSITIRQEDCIWQLTPCLKRSEVKRLLDVFREWEVSWQLDLNEGYPVEIAQINYLTECFLSDGEAVA